MNRRDFLKSIFFIGGALFVQRCISLIKKDDLEGEGRTITQTTASGPMVLRIFHQNATDWDFQGSTAPGNRYWEHVNLDACRTMIDEGLLHFSQKDTLQDAWDWVFNQNGGNGYEKGQKIAIKLNWNDCDPALGDGPEGNWLVANTQLARAVIESMLVNVPDLTPGDILVGDPSRTPYDRIRIPLLNLGANVIDFETGIFDSSPGTLVDYPVWQDDRVCQAMFGEAAHLIDMPLLKAIGTNWGISGVLKDAQGKIAVANADYGTTRSAWIDKHNNTFSFTDNMNTLVQMNAHPWIGGKRRLIIGDGVYGLYNGQHFHGDPSDLQDDIPRTWALFDNAASNSIIFSTDPVAIDCVMHDLVRFERTYRSLNGEFPKPIQVACSAAGLGINDDPIQEDVTPSRIGPQFSYSEIDYQVIDVSQDPPVTPLDNPVYIPIAIRGR